MAVNKRRRQRHMDWHHRKPVSIGPPNCCGKTDARNMSHVPVSKHRAWHTLFNNSSAPDIAAIITETWLDPDYYMVAIPRYKSRRHDQEKVVKYFLVTITKLEGEPK